VPGAAGRMEMDRMTSAELRAILDQLHITQQAAARLLGHHRRSMEKWAAGDRQIPPALAIVLRLLAAGRITADDIERARDQHTAASPVSPNAVS
jgi:DNA-binding transcriptional regulator YiaG